MGRRPLVPGQTTVGFGTRLPTSTLARLDQLADARGVRRSDLVREAVDDLLKRAKAREARQ